MGKSSTTKSFNGFQDEEMNFGFEKKNEDNNEDNISLDLKYRHGLTGKELSRRAKELKKRQNREREQRRDNKTQNYNYAREMQQLSHSVPVEILKNAQNVENSDFNGATMTMMTPTTDGDMNSAYQQSMSVGASASSFGNNHSSPAGQQATKYYYSMSPASANKNMMSRSLENNFGELGSPNADDGFGLRQMLLSPTKFKANRRELRRLFGKLEFESMDKSSLERVFCIVEIGKKSSKTVQLSEFLETENAPYHAIRRVERNVMNSDTGIASVEVLWDVKDRNYASPPPPAAPSSSSACNNNNNNNNNNENSNSNYNTSSKYSPEMEALFGTVAGDLDNDLEYFAGGIEFDASDVLSLDVWEIIFSKLSPRETVLLGATCSQLNKIASAESTKESMFEKIFFHAASNTKQPLPQPNNNTNLSKSDSVWRSVRDSYLACEPWVGWNEVLSSSSSSLSGTRKSKSYQVVEPLYYDVGPSFVRGLIADQQTVTSYNASSVKIWYNGLGNAKYNVAGGRIQTLEAKDSNIRDMVLTDNFVAVSENSGRLRSWSSLDGQPSIHRPMVTKKDAKTSLLALHADSIVACCEKSCVAKIHDLSRDASLQGDSENDVFMDLRTNEERNAMSAFYVPFESEGEILGATCISKEVVWDSVIWFGTTLGVRAIDFNRNEVKETIELCQGDDSYNKITAIAAKGPVVTASLAGGSIILVDRRSKYNANKPIATFAPPWFDHPSNTIVNETEQRACLHLEDERLIFHSESGYDGVCVYDIRKFVGPRMRRGTLAAPAWREDLLVVEKNDNDNEIIKEEENKENDSASKMIIINDFGSFGDCVSILTPFDARGMPMKVGCFARFPNGHYNNNAGAGGLFDTANLSLGNVVVAPFIQDISNSSSSRSSTNKTGDKNNDLRDKCSVFTGLDNVFSLPISQDDSSHFHQNRVNKALGYEDLMKLSLNNNNELDSRSRRRSTQPKQRGRFPKRQGRN